MSFIASFKARFRFNCFLPCFRDDPYHLFIYNVQCFPSAGFMAGRVVPNAPCSTTFFDELANRTDHEESVRKTGLRWISQPKRT